MLKLLKAYYPLFPIVGMGAYLIVFTFAASAYPGGSENLPYAPGYSFFHNFLCDVMDPITKGGVFNGARFMAVVSHIILSFTMVSFFYLLPEIFNHKNRNTKLIRFFGMLSMSVFVLMYTSYHDHIVTLTGIIGTFAMIPLMLELKNCPSKLLNILAYWCFFLSVVVFFIFETKLGFYYLPFLQKITFMFDATWVIWVSLIVWKKNREASEKLEMVY